MMKIEDSSSEQHKENLHIVETRRVDIHNASIMVPSWLE
jgi:hypothetical protein